MQLYHKFSNFITLFSENYNIIDPRRQRNLKIAVSDEMSDEKNAVTIILPEHESLRNLVSNFLN